MFTGSDSAQHFHPLGEVLEISPQPAVALDLEGIVRHVNTACVRAWEYANAEEMTGLSYLSLFQNHRNANQAFETVLGEGFWEGVLKAETANAAHCDMHIRCRLFTSGNLSCILGFASQIEAQADQEKQGPLAGEHSSETDALERIVTVGSEETTDAIVSALSRVDMSCYSGKRIEDVEPLIYREQCDLMILEILPEQSDDDAFLEQVELLTERIFPTRTLLAVRELQQIRKLGSANSDQFLVLPIDPEDLCTRVLYASRKATFFRNMIQTRRELKRWLDRTDELLKLERELPSSSVTQSVGSYLTIAHGQLHRIFLNFRQLTQALAGDPEEVDACGFLTCPRVDMMSEMIEEAIATIEKTRKAFKSRDLAKLRDRLKKVLHEKKKAFLR